MTINVDTLNDVVSNPQVNNSQYKPPYCLTGAQTGIISTLLDNLTNHANLAQESADAKVQYEALSQLLQCKTSFESLASLIEAGKLPEAVEACDHLNALLEGVPMNLSRTNVMMDVKVS